MSPRARKGSTRSAKPTSSRWTGWARTSTQGRCGWSMCGFCRWVGAWGAPQKAPSGGLPCCQRPGTGVGHGHRTGQASLLLDACPTGAEQGRAHRAVPRCAALQGPKTGSPEYTALFGEAMDGQEETQKTMALRCATRCALSSIAQRAEVAGGGRSGAAHNAPTPAAGLRLGGR